MKKIAVIRILVILAVLVMGQMMGIKAQASGKDASEAAALTKLSAMQKQKGATIDDDIDNLEQYEWYDGHLVSISWVEKSVQGSVSFAEFPYLRELVCRQNALTDIDVTKNTELDTLDVAENTLTDIDVTRNTELDSLDVSTNALTDIDVSQNIFLQQLVVYGNQLTTLDVSHNTDLFDLNCNFNQISTLDFSNNTLLGYLGCAENQLTELDLSRNSYLKGLNCEGNAITSLDLSNCPLIEEVICYSNQINALCLTDSAKLRVIHCYNNQLTQLDISDCAELICLWCWGNSRLRYVDVSQNKKLNNFESDYEAWDPTNPSPTPIPPTATPVIELTPTPPTATSVIEPTLTSAPQTSVAPTGTKRPPVFKVSRTPVPTFRPKATPTPRPGKGKQRNTISKKKPVIAVKGGKTKEGISYIKIRLKKYTGTNIAIYYRIKRKKWTKIRVTSSSIAKNRKVFRIRCSSRRQKYYFRVRTYRRQNGKNRYSQYSGVKSVRIS